MPREEKRRCYYEVRVDIVERVLFGRNRSRYILSEDRLDRYLREIDTHKRRLSTGKTSTRKAVNLACDAAIMMRSYAGQPLHFKSRLDLTILMNRVIAGEFYSHNDKFAGARFLGSGAVEIAGLNEEQVRDLKELFAGEGKERKSTHDAADKNLKDELLRMQREAHDLLGRDIEALYHSNSIMQHGDNKESSGRALAFTIPPTLVNPENGLPFTHMMLFKVEKKDPFNPELYTVMLKPEQHGWGGWGPVKGMPASDRIHHSIGAIGCLKDKTANPSYYSEKEKNPRRHYKINALSI